MITAVAILNVVLGLVYTQYGTMTLIEMVRNRRAMGFSHFGAAWIAMAFTCGPHHWAHGIHLLQGHTTGAGILDLAAVVVGFPAGVIWFLLRLEAFSGRRGDRFIAGNPAWLVALPTLAGIFVTALVAAMLNGLGTTFTQPAAVIPNVVLILLYAMIGYYLVRTQLANRRPLGGWSLSGLALAVIFPTCAVMHGVYAYYAGTGGYGWDWHIAVIDWFAVPAAVYFLWVVHALYRGSFRDWNGAPQAIRSDRRPAFET